MEIGPGDPGIVQNVFKTYFLSVGHAASAFSATGRILPFVWAWSFFKKSCFAKHLTVLIIIWRDVL